MSRPDATARPDWASGAEWEGWTADRYFCQRKLPNGHDVMIHHTGRLDISYTWEHEVDIKFPSPAAALRVANCIAAELGGWES